MIRPTAGLDLSLQATGICTTNPDGERRLEVLTSKAATDLRGVYNRLRVLSTQVANSVAPGSLVAIEGPSLHSRFGHQHDRAGLWWYVMDLLVERGCKVISIPPTTRAKYVTGNGRASKDMVIASVVRKHPDLPITTNDLADAVALNDIVNRLAGQPTDGTMPKVNLTALEGLEL